jgi:hypothetical protein
MAIDSIKHLFLGHAFDAKKQTHRIITPLPQGYLPHDACRPFLEREARARGRRFHFLEQDNFFGMTWQYGPLRFARFLSDTEPAWNFPLPRPHFFFWQRISRTDIPQNWKISKFALHQSRIGISTIPVTGDPLVHISPHAKRHIHSWNTQNWIIEPMTVHEYWDVAFRSTLSGPYKKAFNTLLTEKIAGHGNRVGIVGARPKNQTVYEAAFAYLDIPELLTSVHHVSCATEKGRDADAGTGLMAWWLEHLQHVGYRYADFGLFWTPGEPHSWQGFSRFKAQFCTQFHDFPEMLQKK